MVLPRAQKLNSNLVGSNSFLTDGCFNCVHERKGKILRLEIKTQNIDEVKGNFYLHVKISGTLMMATEGRRNGELSLCLEIHCFFTMWHKKSRRQENMPARNPHVLPFIFLSEWEFYFNDMDLSYVYFLV